MAYQIKTPDFLDVGVKGLRGLAFQDYAYALRPDVLSVVAITAIGLDYVTLKPGEEKEILVPLPELPVNADVSQISARLLVLEDAATEVQPEKTRVGVKKDDEPQTNYSLELEMPARPRNVELKLDKGNVFWTFGGTLVKDSYDLPDFAEQANAYLDKIQAEDGKVTLQFLMKSDTRGKVKIEINKASLKYSQLQTQTWENPLDETIRFDRNFELDYGTVTRIPLNQIAGQNNRAISLARIKMDIGGEFGPERLLGNVEPHDGKEFATVSSDYALAQSFMLDMPMRSAGITGFFQTAAEAELYLEIQSEGNGFPGAGPPLAKSNLSLMPAEENGAPGWTFANFEAPVDLQANTTYWIVIKGIRGKVWVGLQAPQNGYLQQIRVNRGGQLWKPLGRTSVPSRAALLRLVYLPEADNQSSAIEIGLEDEPSLQRFDPAPEAKTISFEVKGDGRREKTILVKSYARGTLSLANVIQEYSPA